MTCTADLHRGSQVSPQSFPDAPAPPLHAIPDLGHCMRGPSRSLLLKRSGCDAAEFVRPGACPDASCRVPGEPMMEPANDLHNRLAQLSRHAELAAHFLTATAEAAADPQWHAILVQQARNLHSSAAQLSLDAGCAVGISPSSSPGGGAQAPFLPQMESGALMLTKQAFSRVSTLTSELSEILRATTAESPIQKSLTAYYHAWLEVLDMLTARLREAAPHDDNQLAPRLHTKSE